MQPTSETNVVSIDGTTRLRKKPPLLNSH